MAPKKSLADSAKETIEKNPTALGDPISLKAEKSNTSPTGNDKGAGDQSGKPAPSEPANKSMLGDPTSLTAEKKSLADSAKDTLKNNPSALGDPVSLKAEAADSKPTDQDLGAGPQKPSLQGKDEVGEQMKKGNRSLIGDPTSLERENGGPPKSKL